MEGMKMRKISLITPYGSVDFMIPKERDSAYLEIEVDNGEVVNYRISEGQQKLIEVEENEA